MTPSPFELHDRPQLSSPVVVVGLEGWIDAGFAAARAVSSLVDTFHPAPVATFDADQFVDYRARRPVMHLVDGINTGLSWASIELRSASGDSGDVLILVGAEPDMRWRTFSAAAVELVGSFSPRLVVGMGAYPAAAPHTRPPLLAVTTTAPAVVADKPFIRATLDAPGGIMAALEHSFAENGIPALTLWAQVPHYAAAMPYPAASAALLRGLQEVSGLSVDTSAVERAAAETDERINALVSASVEHMAMVRQLEEQVDAQASLSDDLPSGDQLAAELERYLREQG